MGNHDFFNRNGSRKQTKIKDLRETFLIVCEGERTEPNYFSKFPINREVIEVDIFGEGKNTDSLVLEAINLKSIAEKKYIVYVEN